MKAAIHPVYHSIKITCACGHEFDMNSTGSDYSVDVCSQCHPFYTGKQKLVDTAGRVDKFKNRMAAAQKLQEELAERFSNRKGKESVEEKITRKAAEKEAAKEEEKAKKEAKKKESAKKAADKTKVKKD
ncbi:50S ribosomal protein L31 [Candidatus Peregrinibacteria bacterium]|nr:MAG: 50S ribosomal protein L31 [Candidatus Peregrinibacteria bacterium]